MSYKLSRFNVTTKHGDKILLFNTYTLALMEIEEKYDSIIKNGDISVLSNEDMSMMIENGFVIPSDMDEVSLLRTAYWDNKINNSTLHISIMTTLDCNFRCVYCFEKHRSIYMSSDVQNSIIKFLEENLHRYKALHIDWYGGEPLLNIDCIEMMSYAIIRICEKTKVDYSASITTNGYALGKSVCERLLKCNITSAQVTVDGPKRIHDKRRFTTMLTDTFDTIIRNIYINKDSMEFNIRINVDKDTIDTVDELLLYLKDVGLSDVLITICGVVSSEANPCEETELDEIVLSKKIIEKAKLAQDMGLAPSNVFALETISPNFCIVDLDSQYIISPDGGVYKCGEAFDEFDPGLVGKITVEGSMLIEEKKRMYWDKDPFAYDECIQCKALPICMGGCQMKRKVKKRNWCEATLKYNLEDLICLYYERVSK